MNRGANLIGVHPQAAAKKHESSTMLQHGGK